MGKGEARLQVLVRLVVLWWSAWGCGLTGFFVVDNFGGFTLVVVI